MINWKQMSKNEQQICKSMSGKLLFSSILNGVLGVNFIIAALT
jgi:hypothetical protein